MNPEQEPSVGSPVVADDDVEPAVHEVPVPADEALSTADDVPSTSDATTPAATAERDDDPEAYRMRRGATESAGPVPDEDLRAAVEAILLVVDTPVAEVTLAQVLERPTGDVLTVLEELAGEYSAQSRGMDLRRAGGGWRLYTRSEYAPYVERFVLDGQQARLTQAALETLSVVAYRQPVTRSRISAIRGVGVDGVIRTLVTRGLIEECGAEHETGAHLYRTTTLFLEKLGLNSLEELPSLAPLLPEIEALDDVIGSP
jgi:segregation and condensation protein B